MSDRSLRREATIRDVARDADVSVASVSRTLNQPDSVHPETRERVLKVIEQLRYVPHAGARSLSMRASGAIGVLLPDLHGEFFSELVRGMDREAAALGYQLLLATMHADSSLAGQALRAMRGRVDGWIVMAPQLATEEVEAIVPALPAVLVNCGTDGGRSTLRIDNASGVKEVVDHLVATGRKRILHIAGPLANGDAAERAEAYRVGVAAAAAQPIVIEGDFLEESGRAAVVELLRDGTEFDAIFAANDMMALGALMTLREHGIDVPGQVAVVGFDDIPLARYLNLTSVQVRMDQLGARAVSRLAAQIREPAADQGAELLHPSLIVRESSRIDS